jgi:hypothetical protein
MSVICQKRGTTQTTTTVKRYALVTNTTTKKEREMIRKSEMLLEIAGAKRGEKIK